MEENPKQQGELEDHTHTRGDLLHWRITRARGRSTALLARLDGTLHAACVPVGDWIVVPQLLLLPVAPSVPAAAPGGTN